MSVDSSTTSIPVSNNTQLETTSGSNHSNNFAKDVVQNTSDSLKMSRQEMYHSYQAPLYGHSQGVPSSSSTHYQQLYGQNTPISPPTSTANEHFYHSSLQQSPTYRRNVQIDDLKYSMDRSLHLIRREMDTRLERLEEDVSRSRVEANKLRGIAFSREEDHARILSSIQQLKERNAQLSSNNMSIEEKLKVLPTRNEIDSLLLSTVEPLTSEFNSKLDQSNQRLKRLNNIYLKVEKEINRQAKRQNNRSANDDLNAPTTPNLNNGSLEYIIEQVEARLFHRLEKMIVDRVDLISLRSQDKTFDRFNEQLKVNLSSTIQAEVEKHVKTQSMLNNDSVLARRRRLLLNQQDIYNTKHDANKDDEHATVNENMNQIRKEHKLMQNSLISLRTQVRALARVVSSMKADVASLISFRNSSTNAKATSGDDGTEDGEVVPLKLYHVG